MCKTLCGCRDDKSKRTLLLTRATVQDWLKAFAYSCQPAPCNIGAKIVGIALSGQIDTSIRLRNLKKPYSHYIC